MKRIIKILTVSIILVNSVILCGSSEEKICISITKDRERIADIMEHYENFYTDDLLTDEDLQLYANRFLEDKGVVNLVDIHYADLDITQYLGLFHSGETRADKCVIEVNINMLIKKEYCQHLIERVVRHELSHYICYVTGKNYLDNDMDFINEVYNNESYQNGGLVAKELHSKLSKKCDCEEYICDWWCKEIK